MLGVCMRYANCTDEAEDIMIEGFVKVFTYINTFKKESSLGSWIKKIMVNQAISYFRKHGKHYSAVSIDEYPQYDLEDTTVSFEGSISEKELMEVIQKMPEYYRVVLNMRAFEGMEYAQIAKELSLSESTCRSRFSKARKWLEEHLNPSNKKG